MWKAENGAQLNASARRRDESVEGKVEGTYPIYLFLVDLTTV
jgi:hypothetical protein